ncbi:hypothetical protein TNIN_224091 [Trichonephila inaurata madagascariensis]|uniref:Uncharacterized protein n=1 Tax=Trichonephila inaurata madagascariensis TaxID=2747483 RepID=A0A8X7C2T3_9ARAC|nr:hypothetical protein TNIN_224091 [Trichonephila inaurata madagascariensis]
MFLRVDTIKPSLHSPYTGPYAVLRRGENFLNLLINGKECTISMKELKLLSYLQTQQLLFQRLLLQILKLQMIQPFLSQAFMNRQLQATRRSQHTLLQLLLLPHLLRPGRTTHFLKPYKDYVLFLNFKSFTGR